jgi:hypothetical protein
LNKQDVLRVQRLLIDGTTVGPPITLEAAYAGAAAIAGGDGKFAVVTTAMQKVGGNFQPIVVRFIIDAASGVATALPRFRPQAAATTSSGPGASSSRTVRVSRTTHATRS